MREKNQGEKQEIARKIDENTKQVRKKNKRSLLKYYLKSINKMGERE